MQAAGRNSLLLSEVSAVESVTVTAEGFSVVLPPLAMAMAAQGHKGRKQTHHIATISNRKSALRGGPWTPVFEEIFARAGLRLKDLENTVDIVGHKGPHPRRYHEIVYTRLREALGECRTIVDCRARLLPALDELATKSATPGTELNRLLTQGK